MVVESKIAAKCTSYFMRKMLFLQNLLERSIGFHSSSMIQGESGVMSKTFMGELLKMILLEKSQSIPDLENKYF